jgi:hypothetical protein
MSIWRVIPPDGYTALGDIIVPSLSQPSRDKVICLPDSLLSKNEQIKKEIYTQSGENPMSLWTIGNYNTFMGSQNINKPEIRKEDIKDIKQDVVETHEIDPTESYGSLKVTMKTSS